MAYPDLPPSPTFWRCPDCGNEAQFLASGTGHVECGRCGQVATVETLMEVHAHANLEALPEAAAH